MYHLTTKANCAVRLGVSKAHRASGSQCGVWACGVCSEVKIVHVNMTYLICKKKKKKKSKI